MKPAPWLDRIVELDGCSAAVDLAMPIRTWQSWWDKADRGDWMLWALGRVSDGGESQSHKNLVLAASRCALIAFPDVVRGDDQARHVVDLAERWARGSADVSQVHVVAAAHNMPVRSDADEVARRLVEVVRAERPESLGVPLARAASGVAYRASLAAFLATQPDRTAALSLPLSIVNAPDGVRMSALAYCARQVRELFPRPPKI